MKTPPPEHPSAREARGCLGRLLTFFFAASSAADQSFDPFAPIEDEELLYRCVQPKYAHFENGKWIINERAFTDPQKEISVDRARLCNFDPLHTQVEPTDGVCHLLTGEIRALEPIVQNDAKGRPTQNQHVVCVSPDPLEDNPAHALIFGSPEIAVGNVFRKLRIQLAFYAQAVIEREGWDIAPHPME